MRFFFTSLGCKLNQAEIEALERVALRQGHQVLRDSADADWAVVNTCTVTHVAARKSRQLVRRLRRQNPRLRVAVVGCYAEMSAAEVRDLEGVALVLGTRDKDQVIARILALEGDAASASPIAHADHLAVSALNRTRALLPIQDGCDNRCTYCLVTIARGPSRSRPLAEVLAEAQARVEEGYQELVLTGVHIGAYGADLSPPSSLAALLRALLTHTAAPRLRLSSIEPWDLSVELLELLAEERVCRHVHLPLQSGCDATLRRMGRNYTALMFAALVDAARAIDPDVAVTTDVMVGFPGESEKEFECSLRFIEEIGFSRLHVFRYSPRPGTLAADMPDQVSPEISRERSERLIALGQAQSRCFHERFVRRQVQVLFESAEPERAPTCWSGLTDHYVRVWAESPENLHNRLMTVRAIQADEEGLVGQIVNPQPDNGASVHHAKGQHTHGVMHDPFSQRGHPEARHDAGHRA
jgi:threonylcarbamoyladenosine tRNA methylthiotransferase MtaB